MEHKVDFGVIIVLIKHVDECRVLNNATDQKSLQLAPQTHSCHHSLGGKTGTTSSKTVGNRLPGCTLDVLKLLWKLEQLLVLFLCLLCEETRQTVKMFIAVYDKAASLQCEGLFARLRKRLASLSWLFSASCHHLLSTSPPGGRVFGCYLLTAVKDLYKTLKFGVI